MNATTKLKRRKITVKEAPVALPPNPLRVDKDGMLRLPDTTPPDEWYITHPDGSIAGGIWTQYPEFTAAGIVIKNRRPTRESVQKCLDGGDGKWQKLDYKLKEER